MVRTNKYVGFVAMVLGALLAVGAAAMPVSVGRSDSGAGVVFRADGCGPAVYAAIRHSESDCQRSARRRLLVTTTVGLLLAALGLVLFAGGDSRRSAVVVPTLVRRRRRAARRSSTARFGVDRGP